MYTLKNIHYTEILTIDDAKIGSSGNYVQIGSSGEIILYLLDLYSSEAFVT